MATVIPSAMQVSGEQAPFQATGQKPKLTNEQVFNRMRAIMCSVVSTRGESSGFLFNAHGDVLTVAHNIPIVVEESLADYVQVKDEQAEAPFFPQAPQMVRENADALDLFVLKTQIQSSQIAILPMPPEGFELKEGMKVYFAGYPLGQAAVTFHKGIISSVSKDHQVTRFTIDGTVVPGNSGGPVIIQHNGELYLAGVITAEVADFSVEDQKTIVVMNALKEAKESAPRPPSNSNTMRIDSNGLTVPIQMTTPSGTEIIEVNDRDTVIVALDLIQRNLSTGIGKAIDIRHYLNLKPGSAKLESPSAYSFPVTRGKKLIVGIVRDSETNVNLLKYIEVRYGKGSGNRGIKITYTSSTLGIGAVTYKFSPNPHTAGGSYNKNQLELYFNAARHVAVEKVHNGIAPQQFNFQACKLEYTATLQN